MTKPEVDLVADERPLISRTSILIISAFLIGLSIGQVVATEAAPHILTCGLAGLLAYIAFEQAAARRRDEQIITGQEQLATRLVKHVSNDGADRHVSADEPELVAAG